MVRSLSKPKEIAMTSEAVVLKRVMLEASRLGLRVWRNHTGGIKDAEGAYHRFGLCVGSSDIIGIAPGGRFIAIEVKRPGGKPTEQQVIFIDFINKMGGFGIILDDEKKLKPALDLAGIMVQ